MGKKILPFSADQLQMEVEYSNPWEPEKLAKASHSFLMLKILSRLGSKFLENLKEKNPVGAESSKKLVRIVCYCVEEVMD